MSDAKEKDKGAEGAEQPVQAKPNNKKKKLIFIGLGVVALLGGAGVPMFLLGGGEEPAAKEVAEEESVEDVKRMETLDLGVFIVNLSETSSFLKTHIVIEYDAASLERQAMGMGEGGGAGGGAAGGEGHGGGAAGGEGAEAGGGTPHFLSKKETIFRHVVIRILSSKRVEDVLTPDGKDWLSEELVEGLNGAIGLEQPVVSQIFYTEFIIQ